MFIILPNFSQYEQFRTLGNITRIFHTTLHVHPAAEVLPYMGCIGGPKGYGLWTFWAILVINKVSIFADFGHFGHK